MQHEIVPPFSRPGKQLHVEGEIVFQGKAVDLLDMDCLHFFAINVLLF